MVIDDGDDDSRGYVVPFRPEVPAGGGNAVDSFLDETRILVMGNVRLRTRFVRWFIRYAVRSKSREEIFR